MDIYSLKGLAAKEGVSYDHLRRIAIKVSQGELTEWRGYRFFGPGKKYWLAYPADQEVHFHDGAEV
ncbi:MAG: hypothetical protein K0Q50_1155 [Vampirovibrio sp.]|jgi:hypothetical protein|nr:hypothetical protein [Vampirovibrio sp.]